MTRVRYGVSLSVAVLLLSSIATPKAEAQNGSIEFSARATPSGGLEEPVRGFPFYLLSKSFEEISREVAASYPPPNMEAFIDKLDVSPELRAWMKKNHWVQLSGDEFVQKLTPADILGVPEFFAAYMQRNAGGRSVDFPKPKFKLGDEKKDPAKYKKLVDDYHEAIKHYVEANPQTKDGMDLDLVEKDPSTKWAAVVGKREPEIRRQALELAESKYLVARTQTNLDGSGALTEIPSGNYWLTTLEVAAEVGDARLRWDVPLKVRQGETTRIALSNVNAIQPPSKSP
ncbi:MAG TPA: hypothetical protein VMH00_12205 [Candidatus Limnocylindrales bacterium]|nr:hypothetical protein [Candidatus Limnocylindrales bacterium]